MKKIVFIALLFISSMAYAQTPKRYFLATSGTVDTAIINQLISDSLATVVDSLRKSNDSVYARKGGVFVFQYLDTGGVVTASNFANTNLTANANRIHDWSEFNLEINNWGALTLLSKTGSNGNFSFYDSDTSKVEIRSFNNATNTTSGITANTTQANLFNSNATNNTSQGFYSEGDSAYSQFRNATNTYRAIIGENKFLYRNALIAGTPNYELIFPTWGTGIDTVATLADVRASGGSVDTTSLSNRINQKLNISDTAAMLSPYLEIVDTTVFLRKSMAAYSFKGNLTGSSADATDIPIRFIKGATFTGTIVWTNTGSAPSGDSTRTYTVLRDGDLVTLIMRAYFTSPGSNVSAVTFSWPTDAPEPFDPVNVASAVLYPGSGYITTNYATEPAAMHRFFIRKNAANNGFEVHGICPNVSARYAVVTITYPAAD